MALSKENQIKLLKLIGKSDEEISGLIESEEEKEVEIPEGKVYTTKQIADGKNEYLNSKKQSLWDAGKEFAIKELKEKEGLEFEGKDYDTFLTEYKNKVLSDAEVKPNDLRKRHEEETKALLEKIEGYKKTEAELSNKVSGMEFDMQLMRSVPQGDTVLPQSDLLALLKSKVTVEDVDGNTIYKYNGKEMKGEDLITPLNLSETLAHVYEQEKWIKQEDGGGATPKGGLGLGDDKGKSSKYSNFQDFEKDMQDKGIEVGSDEGNKYLRAALEKNPDLLSGVGNMQ